jgi:hypothetical protein
MTFKVTVRDPQGNLVNDLLVVANDLITGQQFSRSTAAGYADVATFPPSAPGHRVTLYVQDPELRYKGLVRGDAYETTDEDQLIDLVVDPFV